MAERHIDDTQLVASLVLDRPLEGEDDVRHVAVTVRAEHPQADEFRARRHAHIGRPFGRTAAASASDDDAGHMRAMAVRVWRAAVVVDEVDARDDPALDVRML